MKIKEFITTKVFGFKTREQVKKMTLKQLGTEITNLDKRMDKVQKAFELLLAAFIVFEIGSMIASMVTGHYTNALFSGNTAVWMLLLLSSDSRAYKERKRANEEVKYYQDKALEQVKFNGILLKEFTKLKSLKKGTVGSKPKRGRGRPRKTILN